METDTPSLTLAPDATARRPQQERGHKRFETVLNEAEALLLEKGLEGFSIPTLAERLDFSRRSIYKFFPTPYAVLNELTLRYLDKLKTTLIAEADTLLTLTHQDTVARIAAIGADFYNAHPVARLLILGGPVTDNSYRAQSLVVQAIGKAAGAYMQMRGMKLPVTSPDVANLTVEICLTCYRVSYLHHGKITDAYRDEAAYAMQAYLSKYLRG